MKKSLITAVVILLAFENVSMASEYTSSIKNQTELSTFSKSPFHLAISRGDIDTVRKFIKYGVDVNKMSKDMTPLMVAAHYNEPEIIKILLESGARAFEKNERGYTALNYAEFSNAKDAIAILKYIK
jgi:ankyrin repeat protein